MNLLSKPLPVLLLCCLILAVFWLAPQAQAELIINEVMGDPFQDWDGDGTFNYRGDEWIEVLNEGPVAEDMSFYWLRDSYGDDFHLQLHGIILPGEVAVYYGSEAVAWQQLHGYSTLGFSINNGGDTLELVKSIPDPGGSVLVVVDTVTILDHEAEDDRSSGWDPDTNSWTLNDALNPYTGGFDPQGTSCQPSPGRANDCVPLVAAENTTWGDLKSHYR